eukprot:1408659-Alexandrium_andersonii.AAC.1
MKKTSGTTAKAEQEGPRPGLERLDRPGGTQGGCCARQRRCLSPPPVIRHARPHSIRAGYCVPGLPTWCLERVQCSCVGASMGRCRRSRSSGHT